VSGVNSFLCTKKAKTKLYLIAQDNEPKSACLQPAVRTGSKALTAWYDVLIHHFAFANPDRPLRRHDLPLVFHLQGRGKGHGFFLADIQQPIPDFDIDHGEILRETISVLFRLKLTPATKIMMRSRF